MGPHRARKHSQTPIAEHGDASARPTPVADDVLERLIAEGVVRRPQRPKRTAPRPVRANGTVSDLVTDQRR
ncbi:MAG TPA: hypothetical protein VM677_23395 [Actinokineospora sp.]|jgi:hypothetical protein|nr:hypothetical protein [Actinokineospora sp.]